MADHQLRLGRMMPYVAADGAQYPDAFWYLAFLAVDAEEKTARIVFLAHPSTAEYDAEGGKIQGGLARREYVIGPDRYDELVLPLAAVVVPRAWDAVLTFEEVADDSGAMRSFFHNAQPVPPPAPPAAATV